ncbi:DUF2735 domain-containing protein [Geminicoccus flavidas]|uniref:DUF2735 domain-containing protein n=1 Tax=Geminicoccus flavidas TaxID=2506407 RepID=UPI00135ABD74|nr:DUF2735 domain-containing protein [Geminicoccus flavidas]
MAGSADRPSAIIYAFPRRGRNALEGQSADLEPKTEAKSERVAIAAFDSWYHEAAVQEAAKARKH